MSRAKEAPEVTKDDKEIVSAMRSALAGKVGQERFDLWFGAGTRLSYNGVALRVGAPNQFFLEWIRSNFRKPIEGACREVFGSCPELEFHLDAGDCPDSRVDDNGTVPLIANGHDDSTQMVASKNELSKTLRAVSLPRIAEPRETSPEPAVSTRRRFASLDSFVTGETNRLAVASAEMVVRRPGQLTPLMFHGPTSVGKTHLLEGIWTAARKTHARMTAVYLSAEQFTSHFLEALRGSGLPSFRQKYRGVGVLILDDLQFFVGKRATQVELLHTIDTFLRDGRQLVFAADRSPSDLAELGPELTTRLTSGLVCRVEPADHATRLGIITQMARRMKIEVPPDVREFIAARFTCHARELSGALCRLQATSESLARPISLGMAERALTDLIRDNSRAVRLPDIEKAVCEVFGIDATTLQSNAKDKRVSHPRMLAMWLARKHTRAALSEIGNYFGHRTHSTVIAAQKRVDSWMASGHPLDLADRHWPTDDAIRQVERRLAAG